MNQFTWTFVDDFGKRNVVGIAHGAESGHLVVYINSEIVRVDFKVLQDYDYSFFLGDEFVHFSIRAEGKNKFSYSCEIDKTTDTPRNRVRKQQEKKQWKQILALVGGLIGFVLFCSFGAIYLNRSISYQDSATLLAKAGKSGVVRIVADRKRQKLIHQYVANGKPFTKEFPLATDEPPILANGLVLKKEASFQIKYLPANPFLYKIDYSQPTDQQLERLTEQATQLQIQLHTDYADTYHRCLVQLAYEQRELAGIILILNQERNPAAYQRLIKAVSFQNALAERCW